MTRAKPRALKMLEGNPGQRPLEPRGPRPGLKAPACPRWITGEARAEWRRVVPELEALGLLADVDRGLLSVYVEAYARHRAAAEALERDGVVIDGARGGAVKHPAVSILNSASATMLRCSDALGLSPAARARMTMPEPEPDELGRLLS